MYKMGKIRQIDIKNGVNYFYNIVGLENFKWN